MVDIGKHIQLNIYEINLMLRILFLCSQYIISMQKQTFLLIKLVLVGDCGCLFKRLMKSRLLSLGYILFILSLLFVMFHFASPIFLKSQTAMINKFFFIIFCSLLLPEENSFATVNIYTDFYFYSESRLANTYSYIYG